MRPTLLYAVVFITNAAVLVFEIAGARMLAPYVGTSTEVWSGVIAVILGGLAVGYWLGGRLAGSAPTTRRLALLIAGAATAALFTWALRAAVPLLFLTLTGGSLIISALTMSIALFAPTTILLGATSPYATRLALTSMDTAAPMIGRISAIGATGSILGSLITGAILIPSFGLGAILLMTAATLLVLALIIAAVRWDRATQGAALIVLACAALSAAPIPPAIALVADVDTAYNRVWVGETLWAGERLRYIRTDPFGIQCGMYITARGVDEGRLAFSYLKGFAVSDSVVPEPTNALLLGGCNYSFPRTFQAAHPTTGVTVVELDPGMTQVAHDWFDLPASHTFSIIHDDARAVLNTNTTTYDVIFMDAFNSFASIPHQLATTEAAARMRASLTDKGVLVMNVIGALSGPDSAITASLYKTFGTSFADIAVYQIGNSTPEGVQNLLFVAGNTEGLPGAYVSEGETFSRVPRATLAQFDGAQILTDDYAPVEYLTAHMRAARGASL